MAIHADDNLRKQLGTLTAPVELKDGDGNTLGYILSPSLFRQVSHFAAHEPNLPAAAWKEMLNQKGGKPLADIWSQLGQA